MVKVSQENKGPIGAPNEGRADLARLAQRIQMGEHRLDSILGQAGITGAMLGPRLRWICPHVVSPILPPAEPGIFSRHGSQLLHLTKIHSTESNNVTCAAQPLQCTSFCFLHSNIGCFAHVHQQLCAAGRPTQLTIQVHRQIAQSTQSHLRANNDCTVLVGSSCVSVFRATCLTFQAN